MSAPQWVPLWDDVEPVIRARQPERFRWPRANGSGWVGPLHSPLREDGSPSFSVRPDSASDPGAWTDHATGESGSLADLAQRLGIDPKVSRCEPSPPPPPELTLFEFCRRRKLDPEALRSVWRVSEATWQGRPALRFPTRSGIDRFKALDGRKPKAGWARAGGAAHWYGLPLALERGGRDRLSLVNGEPSVWAAAQAGVPAVCLAAGEGTAPGPDLVAELVAAGVQRVAVVYDLDAPGRKGARASAEALRAGGLDAVALELPATLGPGGDVDDLHRRVGDDGLAAALDALPELAAEDATAAPTVEAVEPDLGVMGGYRRPAVPFPLDLLGPRWERWCTGAAEGAGAPVDYTACALLAVAAGTVGNAVKVSPWPGWAEPAVLWVGEVGSPGSGKSPATDPPLAAVAQLERRWAAPYDDERRGWDAATAVAKATRAAWEKALTAAVAKGTEPPPMPAGAEAPPEPLRPRLRVGDATPEAVESIMAGEPRGLLLTRDELSAWLGSFGRYSGAGSGERGSWLEAFGARPHVCDRVTPGRSAVIPRFAVSILGTIQPARLDRLLLAGDDDGLPSRFLWAWPEPLPPCRPRRCADVETLEGALGWLRSLPMPTNEHGEPEPFLMQLTPEAADLLDTWRTEHAAESNRLGGMMASAAAKAPGTVLRLALVLELLDAAGTGAPQPAEVQASTLARAVALWVDYFSPMAERVLGDAALPEVDRDAATLARWIAEARPAAVNARDLRRKVRLPGLTDAARVRAALEALTEAGWLAPTPERAGGSPGRARADFAVRPELLAALDRRAGGDHE